MLKKLRSGAYNQSDWVPNKQQLSQPTISGHKELQVHQVDVQGISSCWHVSMPLDQVSTWKSERQQVKRIWGPDSLCQVSTVTLLRVSSSIKHLRNSNLRYGINCDVEFSLEKECAPNLADAVVAASHLASTLAGHGFSSLGANAPHCLLRSAWGICEALVKAWIAAL